MEVGAVFSDISPPVSKLEPPEPFDAIVVIYLTVEFDITVLIMVTRGYCPPVDQAVDPDSLNEKGITVVMVIPETIAIIV